MNDTRQDADVIEWVVEIVSSYVSNNSVPAGELPTLLNTVHDSLRKISGAPDEAPQPPPSPAVPIRRSVSDDHLVCLEDGKPFKSLKRHLQTVHGMTPEQYRQRWGLNRDYPMVAPAYAQARSALAKGMGLGASRRRAAADPAPEVVPEAAETASAAPAKKPRGARAKAAPAGS